MSLLKLHDQQDLQEQGPSLFLANKLSPLVEMCSYISIMEKPETELQYFAVRIIPDEKRSIESSIASTLNCFPEFLHNRILPFFHYYANRGDQFSSVEKVALVIVYFDYVVTYIINLYEMDMKSSANLLDFNPKSIQAIKDMGQILVPTEGITSVCFTDPVLNRDKILEELKHV